MEKYVGRCAFGVAALLMAGSVQRVVFAGLTPIVPEIDGNSIAAGLGCLAGAVLIIRTRFRK
jgi:hypothetical protein